MNSIYELIRLFSLIDAGTGSLPGREQEWVRAPWRSAREGIRACKENMKRSHLSWPDASRVPAYWLAYNVRASARLNSRKITSRIHARHETPAQRQRHLVAPRILLLM